MLTTAPASLGAHWPAVESRLPFDLVPAEHRDWLRRVAETFPLSAVRFFGFETRLGSEPGPTDCALSLTPAGGRMIAGADPDGRPEALAGEHWDRLRDFFRSWGETGTRPYEDASRTWLEFDMQPGPLAPNLLFGYWPRSHEPLRSRAWLVDRAVPTVLGRELSPTLRANLIRCLEAAPAGSDDFQIGLMCARQLPVVRICVFDLPADRIRDYLAAIGWNGTADRLMAVIEAFRPHADFVGLHIDVGETVFPHIGVEPGFEAGSWDRQPHREPRWHGQFDALSEAGLLTDDKRRAMLAWVGHDRVEIGGRDFALLRGISHLKVVLRADGRSDAKAYFGIAYRPVGGADAEH